MKIKNLTILAICGCVLTPCSADDSAFEPPRPLDEPHRNRPMPVMAPRAAEMAMHLYDFRFSADKRVPSGALRDIIFFDGEQHVPLCLGSPHGTGSGAYAVLDGDPETTWEIDPAKGTSTRSTVLRSPAISDMVVVTADAKALKGVRVLLNNPHWGRIFDESLEILASQPAAPAYRIDLRSKRVTPLDDAPTVKVYRHPDLGALVNGPELRPDQSSELSLAPGESIAVRWNQDGSNTHRADTYRIALGGHEFKLTDHTVFTVPDGSAWHARRCMGNGPVATTILLSRGSGPEVGRIDWRVFGIRHDNCGRTTLQDVGNAALKVRIDTATGGGKKRPAVRIEGIAHGTARRNLPSLVAAARHRAWPELEPSIYHWNTPRIIREIKRSHEIELPTLGIADRLRGPSAEELEKFVTFAQRYPKPASNWNNKIIFGVEQGARGIYYALRLTDRPELLETLEQWASGILSHRNDKRYRVPVTASNAVTPMSLPDAMAPAWPMFNRARSYIDGIPTTTTICIGPPLVPMLCYADYVSSKPDLWNRRCDTAEVTHLERAIEFVREAELSIDYTIEHFVDPETKRVTQPWNRYAAFIDSCLMLARIYETLEKDDPRFRNAERRKLYRDVVEAYIRYMADDARGGHRRSYVRHRGNLVPVMTVPYAPGKIYWGGRAEKIGYSSLDYVVHLGAFHEDTYGEALTDAHAFELGYTWLLRVRGAVDENGRFYQSKNVDGSGGHVRGGPSIVHSWTAAYVPELYTLFDGHITERERRQGITNAPPVYDLGTGLHNFGEIMWLNHILDERGVLPHARRAPLVRIRTSSRHVAPGTPVRFEAQFEQPAEAAGCTFAWDCTEDGKPDGSGRKLDHAFDEPGVYPVTLRVTRGGLRVPALATIVVNSMPPGTGRGFLDVGVWSESLRGDHVKGMLDAEGYPNTPDRKLKATAIDLDGVEGLNPETGDVGLLFDGYLTAPKTASYEFAVSSIENCELFLSTNEDESNLRKLGWTFGFRPRGDFTYHWGQVEKNPVDLEEGRRYRIRARCRLHLRKNAPHFTIAWKLAGEGEFVPVEGEYLSPVSR